MIYILGGVTLFMTAIMITAFVIALAAEAARAKNEKRKFNYVNVIKTMKRI